MADSTVLAGLLDRAGKVFGLAHMLGSDFEQHFQSLGPVVRAGGQSPRVQHRRRIEEFTTAVLDLRDAIESPPDGFASVAQQLRKAGRLAKRLGKVDDSDMRELFPELNTLAHDGYSAIREARKSQRLDDPLAFVDEAPTPATGEPAPADATAGGDFIERLLAGPEDVELTPRELALLEAYLQQPLSLAQVQREAQAAEKKTLARRSKLKLIRDFNRNLQAGDGAAETTAQRGPQSPARSSADSPAGLKPRRRGRRTADYETVQREAQLAAGWERARDAGTYKGDFAKQNGLTVRQLDQLLDRVAARNRRSDK